MFDFQKLTTGEIAKVEELSNLSLSELDNDSAPKGKLLAALAFVIKRRTGDPKFKWEDALDLPLDEAQKIIGFTTDDDPAEVETPPAPKASKKSAPKK